MDERLVAVEQAVPAGQQVALQPALAEVLGEDLHHPAVGREVHRRRAGSRPPRRGRSPRTRRQAGSTRSRRGRRCGTSGGSGRSTSRRNVAEDPRRLARARARAPRRRRRSRGSRAGPGPCSSSPPLACGLALIRRSPRRELGQVRDQGAVVVEQLLGPVAAHPRLEGGPVRGVRADLGERHLVRAQRALDWAARRPPSGRSSPSACAARSSASAAGRRSSRRALARRGPLDRRDLVEHLVERRGHQLVHRRRVVAVDEVGA